MINFWEKFQLGILFRHHINVEKFELPPPRIVNHNKGSPWDFFRK